MRTCNTCHTPKPLSAFHPLAGGYRRRRCRVCQNLQQKPKKLAAQSAWRARNPERMAVYAERASLSKQARYRVNLGANRAWHRAYYRAHREEKIAYQVAYTAKDRKAHPAKWRAYERKNPRPRNLRKGRKVPGFVSEKVDRMAVYARDGGRCHLCGKPVSPDAFTLDHLIPLAHGGSHTMINVAVACRSCNCRRGAGRLPAQLRLL